MRSLRETFQSTPAAVSAMALLVLGLGVHTLLNQPRMEEIAGLRERHGNLLGQATQLARVERENRDLERAYGGEGGASLLAGAAVDPLAFISRAVDVARLTRIELGTEASGVTGDLQVTRFTLRVSGSYPHIVDFVRTLELGPRTVAVQALMIQPMADSGELEARMHVSVYDPIARR